MGEQELVARLARQTAAYGAVVECAREWEKVMKPCGTPNCESPTCRLIYAVQELEAAERAGQDD
jgi:hypothetical protein